MAVLGGTGLVGRPVADLLECRGHEVRRLSRRSGAHPADLVSGEGLAAALDGVEVVVNASNGPPSKRAAAVLVDGTTRIVEACRAYHVCVSIIGIDALARHSAYYRVKVEQEQRVRDAGVPFTIVRATQFHEFLGRPLRPLRRARIRLRSRALFQPIAVAEAAGAIADAAEAAPRGRLVTVAGPERLTVSELCAWAGLTLPVPLPPGLGRALRSGAATEPEPDVRGTLTWAEYLGSSALRATPR